MADSTVRHPPAFIVSAAALLIVVLMVAWFAVATVTAGPPSAPAQAAPLPAQLPDLGVTFIQRQPLYHKYQLEYQSHDRSGYLSDYGPICGPGCVNPRLVPGTEDDKRWPDPGEPVTFTAHVRNHGRTASPPSAYAWRLDGVLLEQGTLPALAAGEEVSTSLVIPWPHGLSADRQRVLDEHTVVFAADPMDAIAESTETNNVRQDRTDALALVVWISQAIYEEMGQYRNPDGETYSFEDWEQWHVAQFNRILAEAVHPLTPSGVSQRLRLDRILICPTETDCYTEEERQQQDGYWGHCSLEDWYIQEILVPGQPDWALLHEWGHQLGLIDLYWVGTVPYFNHVLDHSGTPWLIGAQTLLWDSLMSTIVPPVLDEHTAFALERNLGRRRGNYGEYLLDLPAETRLRVLDTAGQPVSGAEVHVYQVTYDYQWMDQDLRFAGSTDVAGEFSLGGEPYGPISVIGNNAVLFITAYARGQEDHFWLDVPTVNLVYWKGQTDTAVIPLQSHIPPAGVPLPTAPVVQTKVVGRQVWLDWTAEPDLTYDVYRASTPNAYYQQILTGTAATTYTEFFDPYLVGTETARYAVRAISPAGHPSALGTAGASVLVRPEGIAVNAAGQRLVLDNHHMEALFQRPDGAFVGQATSTEEWSSERYDLTLDPQGYVYLQSADLGRIHVFDPAHHLLGVLADNLAGSRGLAYQGEGYQVAHDITGLPEPDSLTLLLAYLDGDLAGQAGEEGFGTKVTFAPGYHDLGASLTSTAVLTYPVTGNIQAASGSVEMWLRPLWDGDDGGSYTLFWWGGADHLHLRKDGISNLVFDYITDHGGCGAPLNVANWRAGDWHHLGFTWDTRDGIAIRLFVDGTQVAHSTCPDLTGPAEPDDPFFRVGSDPFGLAAGAVVDDLRISAVPRIARSANSHLFVAGGGWVAALDGTGRFVAELRHPDFVDLRGLSVTAGGRLAVADAGADRLHLLQFDPLSAAFAYVGSLGTGELSQPSDVMFVGPDFVLVADTGNARLALLADDGEFVAAYTQPLPPYDDLPLAGPRSLAWDPVFGRLVVSDREPPRVVDLAPVRPYRAWFPVAGRP